MVETTDTTTTVATEETTIVVAMDVEVAVAEVEEMFAVTTEEAEEIVVATEETGDKETITKTIIKGGETITKTFCRSVVEAVVVVAVAEEDAGVLKDRRNGQGTMAITTRDTGMKMAMVEDTEEVDTTDTEVGVVDITTTATRDGVVAEAVAVAGLVAVALVAAVEAAVANTNRAKAQKIRLLPFVKAVSKTGPQQQTAILPLPLSTIHLRWFKPILLAPAAEVTVVEEDALDAEGVAEGAAEEDEPML